MVPRSGSSRSRSPWRRALGFSFSSYLWARAPRIDAPIGRSALIPLGAAVATWAFTTATHATSRKYIDEIKVPGQVYLYYAVAVVWVAILLAWGVLAAVSRLPSTVRMASLNLLGAVHDPAEALVTIQSLRHVSSGILRSCVEEEARARTPRSRVSQLHSPPHRRPSGGCRTT